MTDSSLALQQLSPLPLGDGIRSRFVEPVNGLRVHVLEAGDPGDPCLVLLHGFPELAFSWRGVMPALAAAGYHVVAPDQRGSGRTTGSDDRYDGDLASFRQLNLVTDVLCLLAAMNIPRAAALVGHDFGSVVAAWAALLRPDVFASVVLMSAPFAGPPALTARTSSAIELDRALAALDPPRRHYTHFFASPGANADMGDAPQGLGAFLMAYYYVKSGAFAGNAPFPLAAPTAAAFSKLPHYYVMPRTEGMAETVARLSQSVNLAEACAWLSERDLEIYTAEFGRTGFQGGLNWYRALADPGLRAFAGRTIEAPAAFIAGSQDWGVYQTPGALEAMAARACSRFWGVEMIAGAGHWVQQEAPQAVTAKILSFLGNPSGTPASSR